MICLFSSGKRLVKILSVTISLALFLCFPAQLSAQQDGNARYYVTTGADSNGDGSRLEPFNAIAQAEAASAPGDTIYLISVASTDVVNGGIVLKPRQKLIGVGPDGKLLENVNDRIRMSNTTAKLDGVMVQLADHNEIAGIHFVNMRHHAISSANSNYSGTTIHHTSFSGNAPEHIEDERGLVYAIALDANSGHQDSVSIQSSDFREGEDLGAIRVFQSGDSSGDYHFQDNHFSDLGGRPYFLRSQNSSRIESVILDSTADNIGLGDRNSDSIIPYLMGQSEQVMLIQNFHYRNTRQVGSPSNTGIEAFLFGQPRPDEANWCTRCKLTMKIIDSVIEDAVTDPIQFSNNGRNSELNLEIRNNRILGGNPRQGGGAISLNLQSVANSGSRVTLLVQDNEISGATGYGFSMNNRGGGEDYSAIIDFGGGALGSQGNNRFTENAKGDLRVPLRPITARNNQWDNAEPTIYQGDGEPMTKHEVDFK
ncbi:MAG: DUF1565 domain-containing protein [Gammaproteobacteria bacterium]|nr:DUF1565 domain-containing protein [Gammaproteobacteria bacterium]